METRCSLVGFVDWGYARSQRSGAGEMVFEGTKGHHNLSAPFRCGAGWGIRPTAILGERDG